MQMVVAFSLLSHVRLLGPCGLTVACQAPLSMGFSRQEYCSGCRAHLQRIFQMQESNRALIMSPTLAGRLFTTGATWKAQ